MMCILDNLIIMYNNKLYDYNNKLLHFSQKSNIPRNHPLHLEIPGIGVEGFDATNGGDEETRTVRRPGQTAKSLSVVEVVGRGKHAAQSLDASLGWN